MPEVTELRPVVAYVLDLFGAEPKAVHAWRPTMYRWSFFPPSEDAVRQWRLLRPDTLVEDAV